MCPTREPPPPPITERTEHFLRRAEKFINITSTISVNLFWIENYAGKQGCMSARCQFRHSLLSLTFLLLQSQVARTRPQLYHGSHFFSVPLCSLQLFRRGGKDFLAVTCLDPELVQWGGLGVKSQISPLPSQFMIRCGSPPGPKGY